MTTMKIPGIELSITKRDGTPQIFNLEKITSAIHKSLLATNAGNREDAQRVAEVVYSKIIVACEASDPRICPGGTPTVEGVQDLVELSLMELGYLEVAKAYILYRAEHAKKRERRLFKKRTNLKP